jgi:nicotinamidase-related amidase
VCVEGSWGAGWYEGVEPVGRSNEIVITKHRYSPFVGTPLDLYLRSNGIRTVIVTGVVTSGCVESAVRDAFFRDYFVVVPADCVASPARAAHEASLRKIAESFGAVTESEALIDAWSHATEETAPRMVTRQPGTPSSPLAVLLDPVHRALLLVDLQNDFCDPAGAMGRRGEDLRPIRAILPAVTELLARARRARARVIHVRAEYGPLSTSEVTSTNAWDDRANPCCRPGSWGAEFVADVCPVAGEATVVKHRYSAFVDTPLDLLLRAGKIRTVVVAGVATHCCVESTARDANMRDYHVVIPEDAVAVRGGMQHLHRASLETLGMYFGTISTTRAIARVWESCSPACSA